MMSGHLGRPRELEVVHLCCFHDHRHCHCRKNGLAGWQMLDGFLCALLVLNDVLCLTERLVVLWVVEFLGHCW